MNCPCLFHSLALAGLLTITSSTYAGAPVPERREEHLPQVCQSGTRKSLPCTDDAECPNSQCEINVLRGPNTAFTAEVMLVVDDNVSKFDGTEEVSDVIAATVLLETKFKGQRYVLAQTYQNLEGSTFAALTDALRAGPFLADSALSDRRIAEFRLTDALAEDASPSILESFLFQEGDSEIADALRVIFGVVGRPVVVETPKDVRFVEHSNHEDDGLASVVRLKIKVRFVPEL